MEQILSDIYYDPKHPASYGGVSRLYHAAKTKRPTITKDFVKQWLSAQDSYTLNKPTKRKFKRSRVIASGVFVQNDTDLMDVSNLAAANDKVKFLLISIDIVSRKLYVQPLKAKTAAEVAKGFESLWGTDPYPSLIRSDSGREYLNSKVRSFFQKHGIHHFTTSNEVKASYAERVIRTLRGRIARFITHRQNERYIDHLEDIVFAYNNTVHSSIGIEPSAVSKDNSRAIWWAQYWPKSKLIKKPHAFDVGDNVRITYLRHAFTRGYDYSYSGEVFKVVYRTKRDNIPIYKLEDLAGEEIAGSFYERELVKVKPPETWKVEKVLKTRKSKGRKESLVKWLHFPSKFNEWVPTENVI